MRPMVQIVTGVEIVDREMTDDELAQHEADQATSLATQIARDAEVAEREATKQAVMKRLGISADDLAALLS